MCPMERQLVTAKVPRDSVAELDRIAQELGTTRSKLIAWAVDHAIIDLVDRMATAQENQTPLPPGIPWAATT